MNVIKRQFILLQKDFWENSSNVLVLSPSNLVFETFSSYWLAESGIQKDCTALKIVIHDSFFTMVQVSLDYLI